MTSFTKRIANHGEPVEYIMSIIERMMKLEKSEKTLLNTHCKTFNHNKSDLTAVVYFNNDIPYNVNLFSHKQDKGISVSRHPDQRTTLSRPCIIAYQPSNIPS